MTPEERLKRIEKTLDRLIEDAVEILAEESLKSGRRFEWIDRKWLELAENQAQLTANLAQLAKQVTETNLTVNNLATAVSNLTRLFEDHARDGHGGEGKAGSDPGKE